VGEMLFSLGIVGPSFFDLLYLFFGERVWKEQLQHGTDTFKNKNCWKKQ
jgi:hypothetical protein